ncbi:Uncharacterized protein FKW44_016526, partial [Caligus rogercresseyi]
GEQDISCGTPGMVLASFQHVVDIGSLVTKFWKNPEVICLQEIKSAVSATCSSNCNFCLPRNFFSFFTGDDNKRGVLTLVTRKANKAELIKSYSGKSHWNKVRIQLNNLSFSIINAYGPNIRSTSFYQSIINNQLKDPTPFLMIGDLNVDLDNFQKRHPNESILKQLILQFNLIDIMKKFNLQGEFSWKRGSLESRIDHAFVSGHLSKSIKSILYRPEPLLITK